jgi:hypothetical protein
MNDRNQRRKFINKGIKSLSRIFLRNELPEELNPTSSKIKMLTPDGKLVEVDINAIKKTHKTTNKDILEWINQNNSDTIDKK